MFKLKMYSQIFVIQSFRDLNNGELETVSKNGFYFSDLSLSFISQVDGKLVARDAGHPHYPFNDPY